MSDLISRHALCEYALNQKDKSVTPNDIMRFPSAEPKKGEWILSFDGYENTWICSECGAEYVLYDGTISEQHYCPNCGTKMEV